MRTNKREKLKEDMMMKKILLQAGGLVDSGKREDDKVSSAGYGPAGRPNCGGDRSGWWVHSGGDSSSQQLYIYAQRII